MLIVLTPSFPTRPSAYLMRTDFETFYENHHRKRIIELLEPDRRREARRPAAHDHNDAGHRFTFNGLGAHEAGPFDYFTCQTVRQALIAGRRKVKTRKVTMQIGRASCRESGWQYF